MQRSVLISLHFHVVKLKRLHRKWNPWISCNEAIVWLNSLSGFAYTFPLNLFYKNRSALSDWNHVHVPGNENEQRRQHAKRKRKIRTTRERILLDKKVNYTARHYLNLIRSQKLSIVYVFTTLHAVLPSTAIAQSVNTNVLRSTMPWT